MKKSILDDEYEKFIKLYQYYIFEEHFENLQENAQENSQKCEKSYDNNFHNYNDINDVYFVNKGIEHFYNKYDISFSSRNKLFNYLRKICRKFKIIIEALDAPFQVNEISFIISIINNAEVVIIHFIAKLHNAIVKSNYNFRN